MCRIELLKILAGGGREAPGRRPIAAGGHTGNFSDVVAGTCHNLAGDQQLDHADSWGGKEELYLECAGRGGPPHIMAPSKARKK